MKKILVTGATGGIGGMIVETLLKRGFSVVATSRDESKAGHLKNIKNLTYIPYNFDSPVSGNLFEYFDRPDSLVHPAWDKLNEFKNEIHVTEILPKHKLFIENLIANGLKEFNGVGTCYECGLREGELPEDAEGAATLPYAEAKDQLRKYSADLCEQYKVNYKWIRIFYVFGAVKGRKNLYTLLTEAIEKGEKSFNMSPGEQIRDFLSPSQIAENIAAITSQTRVNGIINCCSGHPVKLKDFVNDFLVQKNKQLSLNLGFYPYADYEPMATWGNRTKLNEILKTQ